MGELERVEFRPGEPVNFCYVDESGTGDESVATMVGIVVDATRMHVTKGEWAGLLPQLSQIAGRPIDEFHMRDFYSGRTPFRIDGESRSEIVSTILEWLTARKHEIVYAAVVKESYLAARAAGAIPAELGTVWRFMGFHLLLAMQKHCQGEGRNKGHTQYVFDNEDGERVRFPDLVRDPQPWSDEYYGRDPKRRRIDQVIDAPLFGDSRDFPLIQCADLAAFLFRRHAEITAGGDERYQGEGDKVARWVNELMRSAIPRPNIYKKVNLSIADHYFVDHAPPAIRALGR